MKKLDDRAIREAALMTEAILIIMCILFGRDGKISMCCYWLLTAAYHAMDMQDG
ncbi:MAG: hypothetical protein IJ899_12895 [Blautia sp.]|nr:hypothetical protein [Blautia sp.]